MAWMAATIFVKNPERDQLASQLAAMLDAPERARDRDGIDDVPRPVQISPLTQGWVAINGLLGWLADLPATALELSKGAECAVSCELYGNSLRLRLGQFVDGERRHLLASPATLEWSSLQEHRGPMPVFDDVEDKAFKTLRALGIPSVLLGIGLAPLGAEERIALEDGYELVRQAAPGDAGKASASGTWEQRPVTLSSAVLTSAPPVLPRESSRDFGISLVDERYVEGRPNAAAVTRLLELEESWAVRARQACGVEALNVTLTYLGGTYQEELDDLLRQRGRQVIPSPRRTTPPWWAFWKYFGSGAFRR